MSNHIRESSIIGSHSSVFYRDYCKDWDCVTNHKTTMQRGHMINLLTLTPGRHQNLLLTQRLCIPREKREVSLTCTWVWNYLDEQFMQCIESFSGFSHEKFLTLKEKMSVNWNAVSSTTLWSSPSTQDIVKPSKWKLHVLRFRSLPIKSFPSGVYLLWWKSHSPSHFSFGIYRLPLYIMSLETSNTIICLNQLMQHSSITHYEREPEVLNMVSFNQAVSLHLWWLLQTVLKRTMLKGGTLLMSLSVNYAASSPRWTVFSRLMSKHIGLKLINSLQTTDQNAEKENTSSKKYPLVQYN